MAYKVTTFLFSNLNLSFCYHGSSKTGSQQISAFVLRVALDSSETISTRQEVTLAYDELISTYQFFNELFSKILYDQSFRTNPERFGISMD